MSKRYHQAVTNKTRISRQLQDRLSRAFATDPGGLREWFEHNLYLLLSWSTVHWWLSLEPWVIRLVFLHTGCGTGVTIGFSLKQFHTAWVRHRNNTCLSGRMPNRWLRLVSSSTLWLSLTHLEFQKSFSCYPWNSKKNSFPTLQVMAISGFYYLLHSGFFFLVSHCWI